MAAATLPAFPKVNKARRDPRAAATRHRQSGGKALQPSIVRILLQCIYFPPEVGGLESYVYDLGRGLVTAGHEVTMVSSRSLPRASRRERMAGVDVVRTWFPGRNPAGWALHTFASVPTYLPLAREADVLHAQTFASAPPGILARRLFGKPLVLTLHTSHFQRLSRRPRWRPVLRRIIASADWLLTASRQLLDMALELYPHPRAESITNAVDTERFRPVEPSLPHPPQGRRRVVVPARLFEPKGVRHLLDALPRVRSEVDVEVVIVGDGPLRAELEAHARSMEVSDAVRFLGRRPHAEMPALLSSGDVVCLPSLMEATSIAALEAMACERPVAASRVGGLPELIDEEVGTLFRPADPEDLAGRLVALLRREDLREAGARARERVRSRWSLERLVRRHEEIYRELLEERGGAGSRAS